MQLIRDSLDYASWKDRKPLAAAIQPIYKAVSAEAALAELDVFEQGQWGKKFPTVVASWRRAWDKVISLFAFLPEVRRVIYTTIAIESVNARLRKIIKTRGHFPSDEAVSKLIWLALRNITTDWQRAAPRWKAAMNQFSILYAKRFAKVQVVERTRVYPYITVAHVGEHRANLGQDMENAKVNLPIDQLPTGCCWEFSLYDGVNAVRITAHRP